MLCSLHFSANVATSVFPVVPCPLFCKLVLICGAVGCRGGAEEGQLIAGLVPEAGGAVSPVLLSPFRWMPSVPRRAEELSEDFALRVQEVGGDGMGVCAGLLLFGMVTEESGV